MAKKTYPKRSDYKFRIKVWDKDGYLAMEAITLDRPTAEGKRDRSKESLGKRYGKSRITKISLSDLS